MLMGRIRKLVRATGDYLAWLGGADSQALAQVPSARSRFVAMAVVLITTATLAVISMTFALHNAVRVPLSAAIPFSLFWGYVVILNIDRYLVLSMGSVRKRSTLFLMAAPRLAMAALLALVVSTPLVLRVFASDISKELYTLRLQTSAQQGKLEANSKEAKQAALLAKQINADKQVLAGHLPQTFTSPALQQDQHTVTTLQAQQAQARQTAENAYRAYVCEYSGRRCHGASGVPGPGNLTTDRYNEWQQDLSTLSGISARLTAAQGRVSADRQQLVQQQATALTQDRQQATTDLRQKEAQYRKLTTLLNGESALGTELNKQDTGILAQVSALLALDRQSPGLLFTDLLVGGLFFMIEILPVVVKLLTNLGPVSAYDTVLAAIEDTAADKARVERVERRRIAETESQERISKEEQRAQEQVRIAQAQAEARIRQQEEQAQEQIRIAQAQAQGRIRQEEEQAEEKARIAKAQADGHVRIAEGEADTEVGIEQGKWQAKLHVEDHMRQQEMALGRDVNKHVAGELQTIMERTLQEWSERLREDLAKARQQAASGQASPNGQAGGGQGGTEQGGTGQPSEGTDYQMRDPGNV